MVENVNVKFKQNYVTHKICIYVNKGWEQVHISDVKSKLHKDVIFTLLIFFMLVNFAKQISSNACNLLLPCGSIGLPFAKRISYISLDRQK